MKIARHVFSKAGPVDSNALNHARALGEANRLAALLTLAAGAVIVAGIFVFSAIGDRFVIGLEDKSAEIQRMKARQLALTGKTEDAIARYEAAVRLPWNDPQQAFWTFEELAALYQKQGQAREEANALLRAVCIAPERDDTWRRALGILESEGQTDEALEVARAWYVVAEQLNDIRAMAQAKSSEGRLLTAGSTLPEAAAALDRSYELAPEPETALEAAQAHIAANDVERARFYLEEAKAHGNSAVAQKARQMLDGLP